MNNFKKLSLYLCRRIPDTADILGKQQCFDLLENLDNSLHAGKRHEVVLLEMLYSGFRFHAERSLYIHSRCELNSFFACG